MREDTSEYLTEVVGVIGSQEIKMGEEYVIFLPQSAEWFYCGENKGLTDTHAVRIPISKRMEKLLISHGRMDLARKRPMYWYR